MSHLKRIQSGLFVVLVLFSLSAFASISMNGAGSTFIDPVFTQWVNAYEKAAPDAHFNYQPVGSLQGVDQLLSHDIDFAASDAPLHLEQMSRPACGTLYFPAVLGAVVIVYNLPQLPATSRVRLTGQVLGDIYLGKIKTWNDPAIANLNPGMALPDQQILANVRRDGSGTTFTFTDYLTKVNPEWKKQVGAGMLAQWPIGLPENGNEGVAEAVKSLSGAIGYVELSYAFAKDLPYALMQNRAGAWADANPQTITDAAAGIADQMPGDLQQSITNAPGPSAYPISSYSYLLFFKQQNDPMKADAFRKFVNWILHDGQAYAAPLHYAPLPEEVADRAELQLKQIEIASGTGMATASCKASLGLAKGSNAGPPVQFDSDTSGPLFSD